MGCVYSKYARDREESAEKYDIIDALDSKSSSQGAELSITAPMDDDEKVAQNQKATSSLRKGKLIIRLFMKLVLCVLYIYIRYCITAIKKKKR